MGVFHFDTDMIVSLHGRAPAVATGVKRCSPKRFVYTYQGDGDLAAIGLSEIMHAANRGENITAIFVNNSKKQQLHRMAEIQNGKDIQ